MAVRPVIVDNEDRLVALLRGRRAALGMTQPEVDDRAGFTDGYCAKLEAPERSYGRRVAWGLSDLLFWWLQALGLRLVVLDRETAERLVRESDAPDMASEHAAAYPGRQRDRSVVKTARLRTSLRFVRAA